MGENRNPFLYTEAKKNNLKKSRERGTGREQQQQRSALANVSSRTNNNRKTELEKRAFLKKLLGTLQTSGRGERARECNHSLPPQLQKYQKHPLLYDACFFLFFFFV
ncbi:unnamed protein product [Ixodes persulcatus]